MNISDHLCFKKNTSFVFSDSPLSWDSSNLSGNFSESLSTSVWLHQQMLSCPRNQSSAPSSIFTHPKYMLLTATFIHLALDLTLEFSAHITNSLLGSSSWTNNSLRKPNMSQRVFSFSPQIHSSLSPFAQMLQPKSTRSHSRIHWFFTCYVQSILKSCCLHRQLDLSPHRPSSAKAASHPEPYPKLYIWIHCFHLVYYFFTSRSDFSPTNIQCDIFKTKQTGLSLSSKLSIDFNTHVQYNTNSPFGRLCGM